MYTPPTLKPHEGSWIIVNRHTGEAIMELFRGSKLIQYLNTEKYKAVPVLEYLVELKEHKVSA